MSQRRVGPGRLPVDEGPASAAVSDPMAAYGRLSVAGFGGDVAEPPTGGAGPVERRTATPEELAAARSREAEPRHLTERSLAKPSPASTNGRRPAAAVPSPVIEAPSRDQREKPGHILTADSPTETAEPLTGLDALVAAVVEAVEARDELETADYLADQARLRWTGARAALDTAYRALDDPSAAVETGADHAFPIPEPIRAWKPTAEGGRATAEQLQQSRRKGQAAMQARKPMPAYARRILDALLASNGDRAVAAAAIGYKETSLQGSLTHLRARTDLTERERAVITGRARA